MLTDTQRAELRDALAKAEHLAREHARILEGCRSILAEPPVDMLAPAYLPERVGCMDEVQVGDRAMWDGNWHEVTFITNEAFGEGVSLSTDDGTAPLVSPGHYGVRFQALARPDTFGASDGPMPEGVTEVEPW